MLLATRLCFMKLIFSLFLCWILDFKVFCSFARQCNQIRVSALILLFLLILTNTYKIYNNEKTIIYLICKLLSNFCFWQYWLTTLNITFWFLLYFLFFLEASKFPMLQAQWMKNIQVWILFLINLDKYYFSLYTNVKILNNDNQMNNNKI